MQQALPLLIAIVAFFYASVGHGGASGYLAMMALAGIAPSAMKPAALTLNILVSLVSFLQYRGAGYFKWRMFWPFAIASIPAAFLGAVIHVDPTIYKRILGVVLVLPVLRLSGLLPIKESGKIRKVPIPTALAIGALIGVLSGMLGIGGGILLSPILLWMAWGTPKPVSAVSALFIFVNSIAGIIPVLARGWVPDAGTSIWIGCAFAGGIVGARLGSRKFNDLILKRLLAFVLVIAIYKLFAT